MIRPGVNLHLDRGAAADRAIEKDFARRRRRPYVLGAHQHQKRGPSRPIRRLPLDIAGAGIERDSGTEIALRQTGRPSEALRADCEQRRAATLRPTGQPNTVAANKGLRLQIRERAIRILGPGAVELEIEPLNRAQLVGVARTEAVDQQKDIAVQLGRAVERREMHGLLRPASRSPEKQHDDGGDDDAHPNLPAKISNVYRRPSENVPPLRISRRKG